MRNFSLALFAVLLFAATACGGGGGGYGGGGGGGGGNPPPTNPPQAPNTVGMALPTGLIGVENDPTWGIVGGFTQTTYSQVLAFPVGATITLKNLSATTPHTFNVIGTMAGPPANWPANPPLSTTASGGTTLANGYASGTLNAGASVQVTLANPGTFLIACAYHYASNQMRDVLMVSNTAVPGPQATPPPAGGGGCGGPYC